MKAFVLYNPLAGSAHYEDDVIVRAFEEVGIFAYLQRLDVPDPSSVVENARRSDFEIVVAVGGDGTVSTVASGIRGTGKKLGIVPLGTLNHFARDLRIPCALEPAIRVIRQGKLLAMDTGEINGRIFLNNSSLGIYPLLAKERKRQRAVHKRGKWSANFFAALHAIQNFPQLHIRLRSSAHNSEYVTPLVFVGNNEYDWTLFSMSHRNGISRGKLFVCVSRARTPVQMAVEGLFRTGQLEMFTDTAISVETEPAKLLVAVDGEVVEGCSPFHYRILRKSLEVFVP